MTAIRHFALFLSLLIFVSQSKAHTKLFSTKLVLQNGQPVASHGVAATGSTYVHIWGPNNGEKYRVFANGDTWPSETLVKNLDARQRPVCTGTAPPMDRIARARPGESLTFMWPTNNHGGEPVKIYWDKSGPLSPNAPEPTYKDWTRQENVIFSSPYRQGGSTHCADYDFNPGNAIGRIVKESFPGQESAQNERHVCWATFRLPGNMRPGLNRMLLGWDHPPNDAHFYDCYWVFVEGPGATSYSPDNRNSVLLNPAVFDANYYLNHYSDLKAAFRGDQEAAKNHWLNHGIKEGRRASAQFDPRFYLGHYADLSAAFGRENWEDAIKHYISHGRKEGRRGHAK